MLLATVLKIHTALLCIESVMSSAPFRDADHIWNEVMGIQGRKRDARSVKRE
ncbi:hypothetical protein SBDP1_970023 [Syntrophobacter sp. SbD1]|nr:hypothetical protein SBDP1_970023 [Syntrophobacter sp. SbD1]